MVTVYHYQRKYIQTEVVQQQGQHLDILQTVAITIIGTVFH